ncbi:hypothetical protein [Sorangium sp. So ce1099]|uniref:hypothetical protein n=1 Tax=Sorangium sp. So ce1099 TaxID=3133331 RepID=UPI003F5E3A2B
MSSLAPTTSLGEFVDVLFGVLLREPRYLIQDDVHRHFSMLYQFRQHEIRQTDWETNVSHNQPVSQLPIADLEDAIFSWAVSYTAERHHPLMSTYAIDSAQFALTHAYGGPIGSDRRWRIAPLFPPPLIDKSQPRLWLFEDPQFKKRITEQVGRLLVLVEVPPQARCVFPSASATEVRLEGGSQFFFKIQRCHLSSGFYDHVAMNAIDDAEPEMYLSKSFRVYGKTFVPSDDHWDYRLSEPPLPEVLTSTRILRDPRVHGWSLEVPVRWITHVIVRDDDKTSVIPAPDWRP